MKLCHVKSGIELTKMSVDLPAAKATQEDVKVGFASNILLRVKTNPAMSRILITKMFD